MNAIKVLIVLVVLGVLALVMVKQTRRTEQTRAEAEDRGAKSVSALRQSDGYYVVTGADLHNVARDLIGKRIRIRGTIASIDTVPVNKSLILSEDSCYFVIVPWGSLGDVPSDLKEQFSRNGLQKGDKITLFATIEMLSKEGGITGRALAYKSSILKPVHAWSRGW